MRMLNECKLTNDRLSNLPSGQKNHERLRCHCGRRRRIRQFLGLLASRLTGERQLAIRFDDFRRMSPAIVQPTGSADIELETKEIAAKPYSHRPQCVTTDN